MVKHLRHIALVTHMCGSAGGFVRCTDAAWPSLRFTDNKGLKSSRRVGPVSLKPSRIVHIRFGSLGCGQYLYCPPHVKRSSPVSQARLTGTSNGVSRLNLYGQRHNAALALHKEYVVKGPYRPKFHAINTTVYGLGSQGSCFRHVNHDNRRRFS